MQSGLLRPPRHTESTCAGLCRRLFPGFYRPGPTTADRRTPPVRHCPSHWTDRLAGSPVWPLSRSSAQYWLRWSGPGFAIRRPGRCQSRGSGLRRDRVLVPPTQPVLSQAGLWARLGRLVAFLFGRFEGFAHSHLLVRCRIQRDCHRASRWLVSALLGWLDWAFGFRCHLRLLGWLRKLLNLYRLAPRSGSGLPAGLAPPVHQSAPAHQPDVPTLSLVLLLAQPAHSFGLYRSAPLPPERRVALAQPVRQP